MTTIEEGWLVVGQERYAGNVARKSAIYCESSISYDQGRMVVGYMKILWEIVHGFLGRNNPVREMERAKENG